MCDCWLQPSEQQHCAWINRTLEIHRKCVNVHWLWGSHELRFLRWSRGVVFSPFRHRLRRSDILLSSTNSSPSIGLVENETKNFCVSDSTMHLKTPLKSPADGWGTEADFRNPFLLRSPESQYYNANVPRHLQWRGGLHTTRSISSFTFCTMTRRNKNKYHIDFKLGHQVRLSSNKKYPMSILHERNSHLNTRGHF